MKKYFTKLMSHSVSTHEQKDDLHCSPIVLRKMAMGFCSFKSIFLRNRSLSNAR